MPSMRIFKRKSRAWEVLGNERMRAVYDSKPEHSGHKRSKKTKDRRKAKWLDRRGRQFAKIEKAKNKQEVIFACIN
mgnify:CR=1 FL=1